jgi:exodeoxyribonuclease VII small subunit
VKKSQNKEVKEPPFEECLERLESLVHEMESGNLPLEDILKKYEEGNRLVKACATKLNEAEQRIEVLMKEKNGSLSLKPFEETNSKEGQEKEELDEKDSDEQDSDSEKEEDNNLF